MGCIQLNEKPVARLKIGLTAKLLNTFETKAEGFCEHAAHVVVVVQFFINFFAGRESNDRETCEG